MDWSDITFGIKDVIYIIITISGALSTFFILKYRISKLEDNVDILKANEKLKENDIKDLSEKMFKKFDELINKITDSNSLLQAHIAYHKGMEDAEHKLK